MFGLDVKDVYIPAHQSDGSLFELMSVSQSHRYSSQDVAVVGGVGGCACESDSVSKM